MAFTKDEADTVASGTVGPGRLEDLREAHLFERDDSDEASDAGDVGVVQAQQREDGVSLKEQDNIRGLTTHVSTHLTMSEHTQPCLEEQEPSSTTARTLR